MPIDVVHLSVPFSHISLHMGFSVAVFMNFFIFPSPNMLLGQYVFSVLLPATVHINVWHNEDGRKRKEKKTRK